jgi:hypothetical protein
MKLPEPVAWRVECRWKDTSIGGGWRKYADYGTLNAAQTAQVVFANPGDIESRVMPLYTEEAMIAFRQQALEHVMARIPANLPHDYPYRPVNLGFSQCAEYMRGAVEDLMYSEPTTKAQFLREINSLKDTDKEHP